MNPVQRLLARYDLRVIGLILIFASSSAVLATVFFAEYPIRDFMSFYAAAELAWQDRAVQIYELEGFADYINSLFEGNNFYPWFYPPTTLIALIPFAWIPPFAGYLVSVFGQLCLFGWLISRFFPRPTVVIFALAGTGLLLNALYNQFGTLWACLFLLAMQSLRDGHQARAGLWLALLSMKPHYGILIPVALIAARQWRCIATTCALIAVMVSVSLLLFGVQTWAAFFDFLTFSTTVIENPKVYFGSQGNEMTNMMSFAQSFGAPVWLRWALHGCVTLACAVAVYRSWCNPACSFAWRAALLAMGTFISLPWSFSYDAPLLNVWLAFLLLALPGDRGLYQERNYGLIILFWLLPLLVLSITILNLLPDGMSNVLFLLPAWTMWKLRDRAQPALQARP